MSGLANDLDEVWTELRIMLLEKNRAYGDSVFAPLGIFGSGDPLEALGARIDDQLARIAHCVGYSEDTEKDLLGYLILRQVAVKRLGRTGSEVQRRSPIDPIAVGQR